MLCIHHNDLDGRCAAAIVEKFFGTDPYFKLEDRRYLEVDYKRTFDFGVLVKPNEKVIIVDFSLRPEIMLELMQVTNDIVWCDHHKTADGYVEDYGFVPTGIRDFTEPGRSGAECTWDYFYPSKPSPMAVKITGSYDTWRHDIKGDFAFNEAMKMIPNGPQSESWSEMLNCSEVGIIASYIELGESLIKFRDAYCGDMCQGYGFETEFHGLKCFAMNIYRFGSQTFGKRMNQYDACIAFVYDGKDYTVSMYTEKEGIDVSAVCKKEGGGGHTKAAGFVCTELPFKAES